MADVRMLLVPLALIGAVAISFASAEGATVVGDEPATAVAAMAARPSPAGGGAAAAASGVAVDSTATPVDPLRDWLSRLGVTSPSVPRVEVAAAALARAPAPGVTVGGRRAARCRLRANIRTRKGAVDEGVRIHTPVRLGQP